MTDITDNRLTRLEQRLDKSDDMDARNITEINDRLCALERWIADDEDSTGVAVDGYFGRLTRIEQALRRHELVADAREQVGWLEIEQLNKLFEYLKALMAEPPQTDLISRDAVIAIIQGFERDWNEKWRDQMIAEVKNVHNATPPQTAMPEGAVSIGDGWITKEHAERLIAGGRAYEADPSLAGRMEYVPLDALAPRNGDGQ